MPGYNDVVIDYFGDSDVGVYVSRLCAKVGGRREARTRDLRIANAALSQLS